MQNRRSQAGEARTLNGRVVDASAAAESGGAGDFPADRNGEAPLSLQLPAGFIDVIAERAADILSGRATPDDGWLRGAGRIAAYLDCPRSRVYALTSVGRIPVHHDGSALVARRSELDRWVRDGGGRRP